MSSNNSKKVAKNTIYMFIRMILVLIVGLYTSRVVLNVLGFEDFGIYNVVGSVVVFLNFLKMALNNATYRYITYEIGSGNSQKLSNVYTMAIKCHLLLAILMVVIMEIGGLYFLNNKLNIPPERLLAANVLFQFCLIQFAIDIVNTPFNSNIIAHESMDFYALVSIVEVLLRLAVVFLIISSPFDKLITYGGLLVSVSFIVSMCYMLYCKKNFHDTRIQAKYWDTSLAKEFCSYSGWSLIVNAADVIAYQCMSIFFNLFIGVIANAALGITNQVSSQTNRFLGSFTQAYQPQIIKSYAANERKYFMNLLFSTAKISYFLMLLISVPLVANITYVLKIWLGDVPPLTPILIIIFIIDSLVESIQTPLVNAVHATGNIRTHQIMMASLKTLAILSMYIVIRLTGNAYYMISTWLIFHVIWSVVRDIYLKRLIDLPLVEFTKEVILKSVFITIIGSPLPLYTAYRIGPSLEGFIISSTIAVLILIPLFCGIGLNNKEKQLVLSFGPLQKFKKYLKK